LNELHSERVILILKEIELAFYPFGVFVPLSLNSSRLSPESLDPEQIAEFKEAFALFDKVCRALSPN